MAMTISDLKLAIGSIPDDSPVKLLYQKVAFEVQVASSSGNSEFRFVLDAEAARQ